MLVVRRKVREESSMRRDQAKDRTRSPRLTRRRVLAAGVIAMAAFSLLPACGDEEVESGKFKLRSGASW